MAKRESKWQNASQNDKMHFETAKCESKWKKVNPNGNMRVKKANAIQNGKT